MYPCSIEFSPFDPQAVRGKVTLGENRTMYYYGKVPLGIERVFHKLASVVAAVEWGPHDLVEDPPNERELLALRHMLEIELRNKYRGGRHPYASHFDLVFNTAGAETGRFKSPHTIAPDFVEPSIGSTIRVSGEATVSGLETVVLGNGLVDKTVYVALPAVRVKAPW